MNDLRWKTMKKCDVGHQKEYIADDRISQLGDVVLVSILSLLPLKEAVASSILSRRWRYVWTYIFNFNLNIDVAHHILESKKCKFLSWVTKKHMAPKIVSLYMLRCSTTKFVLGNVPKLVEVSIIDRHHNHVINQVSCCLSQLEILRVGNISEVSKIGEVIPNPILTNIKHLHLPVDVRSVYAFLQLNSIMKAFPCLQRLVLVLSYLLRFQRGKMCYGEYIKTDNCCYNNNLKVVEIFGYYGHERVDKFVMNVIENVVTLKKIIIDPCDWFSFPLAVSDDIEDIWEQARIHAMEELKPKVPSTIEFVCV